MKTDTSTPNPRDHGGGNAGESSASRDSGAGIDWDAVRRGDGDAVDRLFHRHRAYLLRIANEELPAMISGKVGASDVVQETLAEAERGLNHFNGDTEAQYLAWLRTILKRNLIDARRRFADTARRDPRRERSGGKSAFDGVAGDTPTPSGEARRHEEEAWLVDALGTLNEEHQTVIRLRNWDLMSFAEIGQRMDRSEDAARKLWARAIDQLQRRMPDEPDP